MKPMLTLVRSPNDRSLPTAFVREDRPTHRPPTRYRIRIQEEADVRAAWKENVPAFLLVDSVMEELRYPMTFPSVLFVASNYRAVVDTNLILKEAVAPPASEPRIEDTVTYLLAMDRIAARAVLDRNLTRIDRDLLTRRITEERLNADATKVRMQDRLPKLVTEGESIPRGQMARILARNRPHRPAR